MVCTRFLFVCFFNMNPAESDTMKVTMVEVQRLTELTVKTNGLFTIEQQLYQVAVNITWADNAIFHNFVRRLVGMHMLMYIVGAVGFLMRGS